MEKRKLILLIIILFLSVGCLDIRAQKKLILSQAEICNLLTLLKSDDSTVNNWHVKYSEQLNNNSCIISVFRNNHIPDEGIGYCETFMFNRANVYIYREGCEMKVPAIGKKGFKRSPFFVPDSPFWFILAQKGKEGILFYKVEPLVTDEKIDGLSEW